MRQKNRSTLDDCGKHCASYTIPHLIMRLLVFSLVCVCIALPMTTIHETVEEKHQHWFREVFSLNRQNNRNTTDNITTTVGYPPADQMTYHPCLKSLPTLRSLPDADQLKQIAGTPPQRQTLVDHRYWFSNYGIPVSPLLLRLRSTCIQTILFECKLFSCHRAL